MGHPPIIVLYPLHIHCFSVTDLRWSAKAITISDTKKFNDQPCLHVRIQECVLAAKHVCNYLFRVFTVANCNNLIYKENKSDKTIG